MIIKKTSLFQALGFAELANSNAVLTSYITELDTEILFRKRESILILPGGGYDYCSKREGEPVAQYFLSKGYNAHVLEYSTAQHSKNTRFPIQLLEAMAALQFIKQSAQEDFSDEKEVSVIGFSAGGHLAGSLAFMGNLGKFKKLLGIPMESDLSVKALVLGYPVVSALVPTHGGSFANLESKEYPRSELSLERYITKDAPAMFIFASSDDNTVPIQNTLVLCEAYTALKKPFELHIYEKGPHGFSLANERVYEDVRAQIIDKNIPHWIDLANDFITRQ